MEKNNNISSAESVENKEMAGNAENKETRIIIENPELPEDSGEAGVSKVSTPKRTAKSKEEKHALLYRVLNITIVVAVLGVIIALSSFAFLADAPNDSMLVSYISIDSTEEEPKESMSSSSSSSSTSRRSTRKPASSSSVSVSSEESSESEEEEPEEILPMDINEASLEDLLKVDGIGETMANRILLYRDLAGGYDQMEDILKVKDLGYSAYNQILLCFYCIPPERAVEPYSDPELSSSEEW